MVIDNNSLILALDNNERLHKRVNILPRYFKKNNPLTIRLALEDCLSRQSERSQSFIYKKFYGYLMAVALRYMKNEMDSEDVVNESFVKIFSKIQSFEILDDDQKLEKSFKGWIARITANTSIDKLRSQKLTIDIDEINELEFTANAVQVSTNLEVEDILKLLNQLPEIQKIIFNMFEIEGYSHEEVSKHLNIPESTCRTYLTRAKAKLRFLYQQQYEILQNTKVS